MPERVEDKLLTPSIRFGETQGIAIVTGSDGSRSYVSMTQEQRDAALNRLKDYLRDEVNPPSEWPDAEKAKSVERRIGRMRPHNEPLSDSPIS